MHSEEDSEISAKIVSRLVSNEIGSMVEVRIQILLNRNCIHCGKTLILEDEPIELVHCTQCGKPNPVKH